MTTLEYLAKKHAKLAKDYAHAETGFQFDRTLADGSHQNPNAERARQSRIAHEETAAWLRAIQKVAQ